MEVLTAAEKQTTHDHELSSERLPLKSQTMLFNMKLPRREPISQCAESRPYNKGTRFNQLRAIKAHRDDKKCHYRVTIRICRIYDELIHYSLHIASEVLGGLLSRMCGVMFY